MEKVKANELKSGSQAYIRLHLCAKFVENKFSKI